MVAESGGEGGVVVLGSEQVWERSNLNLWFLVKENDCLIQRGKLKGCFWRHMCVVKGIEDLLREDKFPTAVIEAITLSSLVHSSILRTFSKIPEAVVSF